MLHNLLLFRLIIVNLLGVTGLIYAWTQGWVGKVMSADHTGTIWLVVAMFAAFQISLFIRARKVSAKLNAIKRGEVVRVNEVKFTEKGAHLDEMPGWIAFIGLIGNVLGIMLSIDAANLAMNGDSGGVAALLASLGVAFGATIVSGILSIWADIMRRFVRTATVLMLEDAKATAVQL